MEKKVFGLKNVHIAKLTEANRAITYGTPFAIPGAVKLGVNPEGETAEFFADNKLYFKKTANNGYGGDLEIADTPNEFSIDILGMTEDSNGAIVENSNDKIERFALMCEIDGDPQNRRIVFYDCIATRPSVEYNTNEKGITVKTATMALAMSPRSTDGEVKAVLEKSVTNTSAYDSFFDKVYEKAESV